MLRELYNEIDKYNLDSNEMRRILQEKEEDFHHNRRNEMSPAWPTKRDSSPPPTKREESTPTDETRRVHPRPSLVTGLGARLRHVT